MTFKIETSAQQRFTVLTLTGHIETEHIAALKELLDIQGGSANVLLDLREIRLADRHAVGFLLSCEAKGIKLRNCRAYLREWMERGKE
jgi:anti-anti-sigma regulatory factor